ncbi:hypothetical protein ACA910_001342 [Epithemia clementina (nom. ined.)]
MGIKIFSILLIEGMSNALKDAVQGEKVAAEKFIATIEEIVNKHIFGDELHEAQWQMPVSDNKKDQEK